MALFDAHTGRMEPVFVNRTDEAQALLRSVERHQERIVGGLIDGRTYLNVLVFYGAGGTGKTELSKALAGWLGGTGEDLDRWGPPPDAVDAIGRWELNDSQGGLDAFDLLLELRRTVGVVRPTWPAFDLAFTALAHGLRRPQNLELTRSTSGRRGWSFADVVAGAVNDAATLADVAGGGLAGAGVGLIGSVLSAQRRSRQVHQLLERWSGLEELVERCQTASGAEPDVRTLAEELARLISLEVDAESPRERPLVVLFVDHLERLQGARTSGESLLHQLVLALPYVLFIMTGRNALRWADSHLTHLSRPGRNTWPGLALSDPPPEEPRQHLVGNLSGQDAAVLLARRLDQVGADVADGLVDTLVRRTAGWPLHLEAIVTVAAGRAGDRPLTFEDLDGPLPELVNRLFEDLPDDEQDIIQAACLLPYFDTTLVAIAAEREVGSAERLVRRPIVQDNPGSAFPFRLHDEIRRIVRETGSEARGGWAEADWARHARTAMDEARSRFERALEHEDDLAAVHAFALAITLGAENATFVPWLVEGLRRVPSLAALSPLVPATLVRGHDGEMEQVLAYVRASAHPPSQAKLDALTDVEAARGALASTAGLWRAYTLRSLGRWEEALEQFEHLLSTYDDRPAIYRYQLGVTFRTARRFRDAVAYLPHLPEQQRGNAEAALRWRHGDLVGVPEMIERRRETVSSRRFEIELLASWLVASLHSGTATTDDAEKLLRIALGAGHHYTLLSAYAVKGELLLFDDEAAEACLADARRAERARVLPRPTVTELVALRGWVTGDDQRLVEARDRCLAAGRRGSDWIRVEILLAYLGYPVPDQVQTQWLEDTALVAERWVGIYERIVADARRRQTTG